MIKNSIQTAKTHILNFFKRVNKPTSTNHYDREGINHDSSYVKKCLNRSNRLFPSTIVSLKQDFLFEDNYITLCYLSSGIEDIYNRFSKLTGINNIILIDYQFKEYTCIHVSPNQRIYCIPSEVVAASVILERAGITSIDILVDINCGMNLGFGFFSVSSHLALSTYAPLLNKDKLIFIGSKKYLKSNQQYAVAKNYLNCFQYAKRQTIKPTEYTNNGINFDLSILTTYQHSSKELDITIFENKVEPITKVIQKGNVNLHFIQGNIFDYKNDLDVMFLYFRNLFQYDQFKNTFNNVIDFRGTYFNVLNRELYNMSTPQDIIRLSDSGVKSIGFIPLKGYDYLEMINHISKQKSKITDLYFFYFDSNDLNDIYKFNEIV